MKIITSLVDYLLSKTSQKDGLDESIIDVTGQSYEIKFEKNLVEDVRKQENQSNDRKYLPEKLSEMVQNYNQTSKKINLKVPHWKHQYIYSYDEIDEASDEQKEFYKKFKNRFLNGEYIDLEGNSNYCFILLFDLFDDYQSQKSIETLVKLENQFAALASNYPVTARYTRSVFQAHTKEDPYLGMHNSYLSAPYEYPEYRLGIKYKTKLNLSDDEVSLLNKLWQPSNNFLNIEFCLLETLKIYIALIAGLKGKSIPIDDHFLEIADLIARKHYKYRKGSQNYKFCIESSINQLYTNLFKHCENSLRECYSHKRKITTDLHYKEEAIQAEYELKIVSATREVLKEIILKVAEPDEATEIELFSQNTTRWKDKFNQIKDSCGNDLQEFIKSVSLLERLNKNTPSFKNLLLEISKFLSKQSKELSLAYYIKYLYYLSGSKGLEDEEFMQSLHKSLFKTAEQLDDFRKIVNDLIKDRDLDKALNAADKFYEIKRKKIELNKLSIQAAKQQHSETVSLLSEYLKEDDHESAASQEIPKEILKEDLVQDSNSTFVSDISFNEIQAALVGLFEKNNFSVPRSDLEIFARSNSVFESRIIESINEACYDILDDVLIEEEDDFYTMSQSYFNKIQKNDR